MGLLLKKYSHGGDYRCAEMGWLLLNFLDPGLLEELMAVRLQQANQMPQADAA